MKSQSIQSGSHRRDQWAITGASHGPAAEASIGTMTHAAVRSLASRGTFVIVGVRTQAVRLVGSLFMHIIITENKSETETQ